MSKTWKQAERDVASFFGSTRTPLSGSNSRHTGSDSLHKRLFIETKYRKRHAVVQLWRDTKELAAKEDKIPVICLKEKGRHGFWVMCHSSDLEAVAAEVAQGIEEANDQ